MTAWRLRRRAWLWWHHALPGRRHRRLQLFGPVWRCSCGSEFRNHWCGDDECLEAHP